MDDPGFDTTVHALKTVLVPAVLVELQAVWQAALQVAEEERSGDGPVLALGVIMSNPELEAEHDRILERCRAALPVAFDEALPAALDVMDAMLAARYQGLHIERLDRRGEGARAGAGDTGRPEGRERPTIDCVDGPVVRDNGRESDD